MYWILLSGWSGLLSKKNILKSSKHIKDLCPNVCSIANNTEIPGILSVCLISLESHSSFQVLADAVKAEEKMSSNCPLQTPQDASCTHILVFPISANAQVILKFSLLLTNRGGIFTVTYICFYTLLWTQIDVGIYIFTWRYQYLTRLVYWLKVLRYQRGNRKQKIKVQTMQWPEKKCRQWSTKHWKLKITQTPLNIGSELKVFTKYQATQTPLNIGGELKVLTKYQATQTPLNIGGELKWKLCDFLHVS
jgi:hypothetical protein